MHSGSKSTEPKPWRRLCAWLCLCCFLAVCCPPMHACASQNTQQSQQHTAAYVSPDTALFSSAVLTTKVAATLYTVIQLTPTATVPPTGHAQPTYIFNKNTLKFHRPNCYSVNKIKEKNKGIYTGNRFDLINLGYIPCKNCTP